MERVVGGDAKAQFREIGSPDRDRSGRPDPLHDRRIARRDQIGEGGETLSGGCPGQVDVLLYGARHAVQRAEWFSSGNGRISRDGVRSSLVCQHPGDGIAVVVDLGNSCEMGIDHLDARDGAGRDQVGQLAGRLRAEFVHPPSPSGSEVK